MGFVFSGYQQVRYLLHRMGIKHILESSLTLSASFWFGFVALRPKSTAMVIAGRSVHLTTLFPGQA